MPFFGNFCQLGGFRHLRQTVCFANGAANSQVFEWHYVRPPQREYEEHLRGPDSYATDFGKQGDDLRIFESVELAEVDAAGSHVFGEIG
jgi:hypothetical protein